MCDFKQFCLQIPHAVWTVGWPRWCVCLVYRLYLYTLLPVKELFVKPCRNEDQGHCGLKKGARNSPLKPVWLLTLCSGFKDLVCCDGHTKDAALPTCFCLCDCSTLTELCHVEVAQFNHPSFSCQGMSFAKSCKHVFISSVSVSFVHFLRFVM